MGLIVLPNGEPATQEVQSSAILPRYKEGTSAVENFYEVRFESRADAEKWVARCRVRWSWMIGVVDLTPDEPEPTWAPQARRYAGAVHDTESPNYKFETGDVKLEGYVTTVEVKDKCFAVVGKI